MSPPDSIVDVTSGSLEIRLRTGLSEIDRGPLFKLVDEDVVLR